MPQEQIRNCSDQRRCQDEWLRAYFDLFHSLALQAAERDEPELLITIRRGPPYADADSGQIYQELTGKIHDAQKDEG